MKFSATVTLQYDTPYSPFRAGEYEKSLGWLRDSGFDGAEICISDYRQVDTAKLWGQLTSFGLECSTISTGQARGRENISLLQGGEAGEGAARRLMEHIDAASVLGGKVTLGLLRGQAGKLQEQEARKRLADRLGRVLEYAGEKKVLILIEAINRYETDVLNSAWETRDFIEKELAGAAGVGILWDTFHANIEDACLAETISIMGKRLAHVHLADSNRMFPGYGHLDFGEIFRGLRRVGFEGYCSFECLNLPDVQTVRCQAGAFIRWAESVSG